MVHFLDTEANPPMTETKQKTNRTGRNGHPRREDWRLGPSLLDIEPYTAIVAEVTWQRARVRAIVESTTDGIIKLDVGGEHRTVNIAQIRRWRQTPAVFEPGAFVLRRDIPRDEWRGVVIDTDGFEVEVEVIGGIERRFVDELESAWDRPETEEPPPVKRGRIAADPAAETINGEAYAAGLAARQQLLGVDEDGWAT